MAKAEVPTFAEAGFKDMDMGAWYAFLAPAATPREVVAKLNATVNAILGDRDFVATNMTSQGMVPMISTPHETGSSCDVSRSARTPVDGLRPPGLFPTIVGMNAWFHVKTGTAWLLGATLVLAGAVLVLQLAALLAWQYSVALDTRSWPRLPLTLVFADHANVTATTAQFLPVIPEIPWSWLRNPQNADTLPHVAATSVLGELHVGLIPALLGLFVAYLGIQLILRQKQRYAVARLKKDDRLRRVRAYRRETRTEPNFTDLRTETTLTEPSREPRLSA